MDTLGAGNMSLMGRLLSLFGGLNCTRAIEKYIFGIQRVFFIRGSTVVYRVKQNYDCTVWA